MPSVALFAFLFFPNFFFSVCFANTHFLANHQSGAIDSVSDSPFQIRQPHSLPDLLGQLEWIQELTAIRTFIRDKQANIDQRYGEDDPEIEKKVRETDEDCVRSKPMELQTENFVVTYPIDIMPKFVIGKEPIIHSTTETLKMDFLSRMFPNDELGNSQQSLSEEPNCAHLTGTTEERKANEELRSFVSEYQLAQLNEEQLHLLGLFLAQKLTSNDEKSRELALYYAHFYWRIRGDPLKSQQCLRLYLKRRPNCVAAKLQSGLVHLRIGDYPSAIELLQSVNSIVTNCVDCLMALGDAFVLDGNYKAGIQVFDMAFKTDPKEEMALKKASLLRCTLKLFEVMENQHKNLLEIIKDKEAYRDKTKRMQQLEAHIEQNRAVPEHRLQARLAHKFIEFGTFPYLKCREGTQWMNGIHERKRLFCTVNNWTKFEEAIGQREREKAAQKVKEEEKKRTEEKGRKVRTEKGDRAETEQYLDRMGPFVGMKADEPQMEPKYPLEKKTFHRNSTQIYQPNWPSLTECRRNYNELLHKSTRLHQLFISPQNKGFITAEFFTKYLGLGNGQLTPLPWELPRCNPSHFGGELSAELKFIPLLNDFKRLKSTKDNSKIYSEKSLRDEFSKMIGFDPTNEQNSGQHLMMGEIGQRINNLIKFSIGPKWMSLNFAALFFRFLGFPSEAVNCLEAALTFPQFLDISLTQLAQLLFHLNPPMENAKKENDGIETILRIAMQTGENEPIPFHLMGIFHLRQNRSVLADRFFREALDRDPNFEPALNELLRMKCTQRVGQKPRLIRDIYAPICCWPNEQNVVCFKRRAKESAWRESVRCFRLESPPVSSGGAFPAVHFVYFRCNTPYTGRSYPPPPFAPLVAPLLRPAAELRQIELRRFIQQIEEEESLKAKRNERTAHRPPVLALDYGGYSEERIEAHLSQIWPQGVGPGDLRQQLNFEDSENEQQHQPRLGLNASAFDTLQHRHQVVSSLDIALPKDLPIPPPEMVKKGESLSPSLSRNSLPEICQSHRKASQLLEQPVSSWVSVTAKGILVEDLFDLNSPLPAIGQLEPECSDPAVDPVLRELDSLPAFQYRHQLTKFYKPEKALRNTLRSLGSSGKVEQIEHVAARLYFAMKSDEVHWALSTLSALYWRVKGDPVNAIKCLRHSLHKSPNKFQDVPLISLANIYHQAGFLHSALIVGRKALEAGVDVVALHFTLANIYASLSDFPHALQFYHSTLALQSNFEPANLRILAVHCVTNGTLLPY
ncbi:hypothetical protein niasHS_010864 [Heterodera schachtii]|uniref:Tetratricopeptide repeat protein 17 n=1 Tax=Heterodera schachtii TaxID=97005 RepID=A0ABD2ISV1_HETSC